MHPGIVDVHPGILDAYPRILNAYPRILDAHREIVAKTTKTVDFKQGFACKSVKATARGVHYWPRGRAIAAYYYLPRRGGRPIGVEITTPGTFSVVALNRLLRGLGFPPVRRQDVAPLIVV